MVMKVVIITLLSLLLLLTNASSLNTHKTQPPSHDSAPGSRKLMLNLKVEGFENKDLVTSDEQKKVVSGEWHDEIGEAAAAAKGSSRLFTMDYSPVRRRRPVHNKALPTTINSP